MGWEMLPPQKKIAPYLREFGPHPQYGSLGLPKFTSQMTSRLVQLFLAHGCDQPIHTQTTEYRQQQTASCYVVQPNDHNNYEAIYHTGRK